MKEQRVEPASETPADRALLASDFEEREHGAAAVSAPHRGDAGEQEEFGAPTKSSPVSVAHDFAGSSPPESPRSDHGRPQPPKESHYDACWESLYTQYNQKVAMHSLAEHFCSHRHFWLLFLPLQLVVATSATLALLASATNTTANNSHIQRHLALSAGILGFVVSFLSALDRYTDYRSKAEMHRQAVVVYTKIKSILETNRVQVMKDATTTLPLEDLQAKIKDLEDSNSVMVPQQIRNAFEGLEAHVLHNFKMAARIQDQGRRASTRIRARVVLRSSADKNFFLRVLHEKVATVITESRGWPLLLPNSGAVIRLSHAKAMHLLVEEYAGAFEC
mmetsp:Transcript_3508/g.10842  ORF Transcript_3508/g.10842 Transcript_3508/m.10842 type:complete len:334 (-) Transcript_3508:136-1137(-)